MLVVWLMGHAADLRDAQFKACLVASKVVADQLAVPVAKEVSGMFASTARTEVIASYNHLTQGGSSPLGAEHLYFFALSAALAARVAKLSGGMMPSFSRAVAE